MGQNGPKPALIGGFDEFRIRLLLDLDLLLLDFGVLLLDFRALLLDFRALLLDFCPSNPIKGL